MKIKRIVTIQNTKYLHRVLIYLFYPFKHWINLLCLSQLSVTFLFSYGEYTLLLFCFCFFFFIQLLISLEQARREVSYINIDYEKKIVVIGYLEINRFKEKRIDISINLKAVFVKGNSMYSHRFLIHKYGTIHIVYSYIKKLDKTINERNRRKSKHGYS